MKIKENGYFISDEEISNFNNSLFNTIINAEEVLKIFGDIENSSNIVLKNNNTEKEKKGCGC